MGAKFANVSRDVKDDEDVTDDVDDVLKSTGVGIDDEMRKELRRGRSSVF